jgi:F-type H+-transporting ATPase subunit epsilon
MQVELVSPERILYSGDADMIVCRTSDGDIAFMDNHAPFIGALGIGPVRIYANGSVIESAAVHGGFVEVSNNKVTILSDVAELKSQIDLRRAEDALARAEAALARQQDAEVEAAIRRATVRVELGRAA